jgi:HK97 family phage major capsid protein
MSAIQRLYETSNAARELEAMLTESEGELTAEMEGHFDILAQQAENLPAAIDDVLSLVAEIEHRAAARKAEADRLKARAKRDEAVAEWFKGQVLRAMQAQGIKKLECSRWRATAAMPGGKPSMEIVDAIPEDYYREVVTREIDKDKIRAALDGGTVLPFARLVPKQPYLKVS